MLAALGSSFFSPTFLLLPIQFLCYNLLKGVINLLSIQSEILNHIHQNPHIHYSELVNSIQQTTSCPFRDIDLLLIALNNENLISASSEILKKDCYFEITPKGLLFYLTESENQKNANIQKQAADNLLKASLVIALIAGLATVAQAIFAFIALL